MKWLLLVLAACTSQSDTQATYLPSDAMFIRNDVPSCLQQYPDNAARGYPCCQTLWFGRDGEAVKSSGQEGFPGKYTLDGPDARGTIFGQDFVFDFSTGVATGGHIDGEWLADTDNLAASACEP
jgi:hypothetical protein